MHTVYHGHPHTAPQPMTDSSDSLMRLRVAHEAVTRAAGDIAAVADDLRRYQKFAKPGQPSAHIVGLRQRQAAARQAAARARQAFVVEARRFVDAAGLVVPPRISLEAFATAWLADHPPGEAR